VNSPSREAKEPLQPHGESQYSGNKNNIEKTILAGLKREKKWKTTKKSFKDERATSFGTGFDIIIDQVRVLHPDIDLLDTNYYKTVVNGQLVED